MKIVVLNRDLSNSMATVGTVSIDGAIICQSLELPWVDANGDLISDKMVSCIDSGVYICKRRTSAKFGEVFEVTGVKDRTAILIHIGNYVSQINGCIALGMIRGTEPNGTPCVYKSKEAFTRFMKIMEKEKEFELRIN